MFFSQLRPYFSLICGPSRKYHRSTNVIPQRTRGVYIGGGSGEDCPAAEVCTSVVCTPFSSQTACTSLFVASSVTDACTRDPLVPGCTHASAELYCDIRPFSLSVAVLNVLNVVSQLDGVVELA